MPIHSLIYVSTAAREYSQKELAGIIDDALLANSALDITGMLVYSRGTFMQVLEGAQNHVDATFKRIQRDPRHHSIMVIYQGHLDGRSFPGWAMAFRSLGDKDMDNVDGFVPLTRTGFDFERLKVNPGLALSMLQDFARR